MSGEVGACSECALTVGQREGSALRTHMGWRIEDSGGRAGVSPLSLCPCSHPPLLPPPPFALSLSLLPDRPLPVHQSSRQHLRHSRPHGHHGRSGRLPALRGPALRRAGARCVPLHTAPHCTALHAAHASIHARHCLRRALPACLPACLTAGCSTSAPPSHSPVPHSDLLDCGATAALCSAACLPVPRVQRRLDCYLGPHCARAPHTHVVTLSMPRLRLLFPISSSNSLSPPIPLPPLLPSPPLSSPPSLP